MLLIYGEPLGYYVFVWPMKLTDIILLSLSVVLTIIGVHQAMNFGIQNSYFIFMFTIGILLYYFYRKKQYNEMEDDEPSNGGGKRKK